MSPSIFLDYPFTFSSIVNIELEPRSDIEYPDKVISMLLESSQLTCLNESEYIHPEKSVSDEIHKINDPEFTRFPNTVKILQAPKFMPREKTYLCEVTHKGLFTLNKSIKSHDIAKKVIEFFIINELGCISIARSDFNDVMEELYENYQEVIEMAYHSIKFISKGDFQVGDPTRNYIHK